MREELGKLSSRDADALQQKVALLQMREVFLPLHTSTLNGLVNLDARMRSHS